MAETARTISLNKPTAVQSPPCDLWPGDVVSQCYRLDTLLGWGGQAVVFQATDLRQRQNGRTRVVAVKIVRTDLPPEAHREAVTVLRWEERLLRRLRHPALPRAIRFHSEPGLTWLARDMIAGTPLSELTVRGGCSSRQVHQWALQICDLLTYLHTCNPAVICGDLKPSNLILRPDGSLALIDLGAALTRTRRPPKRPRPRHGTPGYASPEQMGTGTNDERSDLFSLAATCYELLTGNDPTAAPLQFDFQRLTLAAPTLAPSLRWALALDPAHRAPTAAALQAALTMSATPRPLRLGWGVSITHQRDLVRTAMQHPRLLEEALAKGSFERWLITHPDRVMGKLLHDWRLARQAASPRQAPVEVLIGTLAPPDGSPLLKITPETLHFGDIPLRQWRLWSTPQGLTLHNTAAQPLRWEIECPHQARAAVRMLINGRPVRQHSGVLLPNETTELPLVAAGRQGRCRGTLTVRCGRYVTPIEWEGTARALLALGPHFFAGLEELDLAQPNLVPMLEALLRQGLLRRWLHAQGKRALAAELAPAAQTPAPDALTIRLLVARVLHQRDPARFPLLHLSGTSPENLSILAGQRLQHTIEIENRGGQPCRVRWNSHCRWAYVEMNESILPAGGRLACGVTLAPPANSKDGMYQVNLDLQAGDLTLPIQFPVQVVVENWWGRMFRWFVGS